MFRPLKIISRILIVLMLFIGFSIVYLSNIRKSDIRKQTEHVNNLTNFYNTYESSSYNNFVNANINNKSLNEVQFLASHNSYKKKITPIGRLFVGLGDSFSEAKSLKYVNKTLTKQLSEGIYSFELDLRYRKNEFEVTHVPLVDNASVAPKFSLALDELSMFMDNEPNGFPIIVLLEIKDDYNFLDFSLKKIKAKQILQLNEELATKFRNKLYKPKNLLKTHNNIMDAINNDGWPTINELQGKIIFVIHASKYANTYLEDVKIKDQSMFTSTYKDNLNVNAPFIIHNSLDVLAIKELVDANYIVRTRIGNSTDYNEDNVLNAIASGAQVLTTDFSIARSDIKNYLYFDNKDTIKIR